MEQENQKNKLTKNNKENGIKNNLLIKSKKELKGITLIALVITIVLNCWRSGRNKVNNLQKYKKMILKTT